MNGETKEIRRLQKQLKLAEVDLKEARSLAQSWRNQACKMQATGSTDYTVRINNSKLPWEDQ